MSDRFLEQRVNVKFCVKLEKNTSDTCAMFTEAYGGEATKRPSVSESHKQLKKGRENVEDDENSGRPKSQRTDENIENMRNLMHSDRRLTIRALVVQLNLDKETLREI
jgi:hypothetical protein